MIKKMLVGSMVVAGLMFSGAALATDGMIEFFYPSTIALQNVPSVAYHLAATNVYVGDNTTNIPFWATASSAPIPIPTSNCNNGVCTLEVTSDQGNVHFNQYVDENQNKVPSAIAALDIQLNSTTDYPIFPVYNPNPMFKNSMLYIDIFYDPQGSAVAKVDCIVHETAHGVPKTYCKSVHNSPLAYAIVNAQ